jgi:hypothetical protein
MIPGMSAEAIFQLHGAGPALQVPRDALVRGTDGGHRVWVIERESGETDLACAAARARFRAMFVPPGLPPVARRILDEAASEREARAHWSAPAPPGHEPWAAGRAAFVGMRRRTPQAAPQAAEPAPRVRTSDPHAWTAREPAHPTFFAPCAKYGAQLSDYEALRLLGCSEVQGDLDMRVFGDKWVDLPASRFHPVKDGFEYARGFRASPWSRLLVAPLDICDRMAAAVTGAKYRPNHADARQTVVRATVAEALDRIQDAKTARLRDLVVQNVENLRSGQPVQDPHEFLAVRFAVEYALTDGWGSFSGGIKGRDAAKFWWVGEGQASPPRRYTVFHEPNLSSIIWAFFLACFTENRATNHPLVDHFAVEHNEGGRYVRHGLMFTEASLPLNGAASVRMRRHMAPTLRNGITLLDGITAGFLARGGFTKHVGAIANNAISFVDGTQDEYWAKRTMLRWTGAAALVGTGASLAMASSAAYVAMNQANERAAAVVDKLRALADDAQDVGAHAAELRNLAEMAARGVGDRASAQALMMGWMASEGRLEEAMVRGAKANAGAVDAAATAASAISHAAAGAVDVLRAVPFVPGSAIAQAEGMLTSVFPHATMHQGLIDFQATAAELHAFLAVYTHAVEHGVAVARTDGMGFIAQQAREAVAARGAAVGVSLFDTLQVAFVSAIGGRAVGLARALAGRALGALRTGQQVDPINVVLHGAAPPLPDAPSLRDVLSYLAFPEMAWYDMNMRAAGAWAQGVRNAMKAVTAIYGYITGATAAIASGFGWLYTPAVETQEKRAWSFGWLEAITQTLSLVAVAGAVNSMTSMLVGLVAPLGLHALAGVFAPAAAGPAGGAAAADVLQHAGGAAAAAAARWIGEEAVGVIIGYACRAGLAIARAYKGLAALLRMPLSVSKKDPGPGGGCETRPFSLRQLYLYSDNPFIWAVRTAVAGMRLGAVWKMGGYLGGVIVAGLAVAPVLTVVGLGTIVAVGALDFWFNQGWFTTEFMGRLVAQNPGLTMITLHNAYTTIHASSIASVLSGEEEARALLAQGQEFLGSVGEMGTDGPTMMIAKAFGDVAMTPAGVDADGAAVVGQSLFGRLFTPSTIEMGARYRAALFFGRAEDEPAARGRIREVMERAEAVLFPKQ